ncbi:MAG: hypothetical protein OWT28_05230 [Firmicutes bacterium]|nr:hypothetical protein [Bacillota bacterium]
MPDELITTLFSVAVSFCMLVLVLLAPTLVWAKMQVSIIAQDAAQVAAITDNARDVQRQITTDAQNAKLPLTFDGQTLFTLTEMSSSQPGATGFTMAGGADAPSTTVTIDYQAPLPFDRVLTLFGGPTLPVTIPISESATAYNETQYTGTGE